MYLYILEDGTILKNFCEPTESDIESCDEGVLSIIKIEDGSSFPQEYQNGEWVDIEQYFED